MTPNLRAAAERLRKHWPDTTDGVSEPLYSLLMDCKLLAQAWLAENDETPISSEWMASLGFAFFEHGRHLIGDIAIDERTGWHLWLRVRLPDMEATVCQGVAGKECDERILTKASMKTRGDVRRLCRALGVEIKE